MKGRRRDDSPESAMPSLIEVGDYWKILDENGQPKLRDAPGKLTKECWHLVVPLGGGIGIANLELHTVREHDDGTISVRPGDGSSNSILVHKGMNGPSWHGYVEHGELREA